MRVIFCNVFLAKDIVFLKCHSLLHDRTLMPTIALAVLSSTARHLIVLRNTRIQDFIKNGFFPLFNVFLLYDTILILMYPAGPDG